MRLVLDTNVVLDLFHWGNPLAAPILTAARARRATLLTNAACMAELERVIARPEFGLDGESVQALLRDYRAVATEAAPAPQPLHRLPRCRDPDDQKFLELARDAGADLLVTRDKALLRLARSKFGLSGFRIAAPPDAVGMLRID
jgi:uncharacterized protein